MDILLARTFQYIAVVLSATFHEYMHGWMAYRLGDPTAKNEGRLTLNPLAHIDMIGTLLLPLAFMAMGGGFIGWARPVPYNPHFLRDPKYGSLKVAAAGPAANFIIAVVVGLLLRFIHLIPGAAMLNDAFFTFLAIIVYINLSLFFFNLIPFPPLDGSKIFADLFPRAWIGVMRMGFSGIFIALLASYFFLGPLTAISFWAITGFAF